MVEESVFVLRIEYSDGSVEHDLLDTEAECVERVVHMYSCYEGVNIRKLDDMCEDVKFTITKCKIATDEDKAFTDACIKLANEEGLHSALERAVRDHDKMENIRDEEIETLRKLKAKYGDV